MSVLPVGFGSSGSFSISNSVRLRASASAYFSRTFSGAAATKQTWRFLCKRSKFGGVQNLVSCGTSGTSYAFIRFNADDTLYVVSESGGFQYGLNTSAVFRDPSAWYDIQVTIDTTDGTAADRIKIQVNGVRQAIAGGSTNPSASYTGLLGSAIEHNIGRRKDAADSYFDGYLADVYFIDGQALTPSSFGETNSDGVWVPKAYSGTYGTNGFHLDFKDAALTAGSNAGLGKDVSGNGNYWTTNNISVTAGVTYDSMVDTPTNNYATLNPLDNGGNTLSAGNLTCATPAGSFPTTRSSVGITSGKWYWETYVTSVGGGGSSLYIGIAKNDHTLTTWLGNSTSSWAYDAQGNKVTNAATVAYGSTYTATNLIGVAFDADAGTITFYKDNVSQGQAYSGLTSGPYFPALSDGSSTYFATFDINFGQRPFTYTPPTGFKALCTANLPEVAIPKPALHFDVNLYTGTGAAKDITGIGFKPDLVWLKSRSATYNNHLYDSVRGVYKWLLSDTTGAEATDGTGFTAFNSDGFSLGTGGNGQNISGGSYVDWLWKANGAGVSNTDGSITSTVSANQTAGFSIVTYTGTGANATVGHGLGVVPKMVIVKRRTVAGGDWDVYHQRAYGSSDGRLGRLFLNQTAAFQTTSVAWNDTAPTSAVFSLGTGANGNSNTNTHVAYCFAEIAGYSKFGSYVGNGSTDGPFVFCGFRPRFIMLKATTAIAGNWVIHDTARNTYNDNSAVVYPNLSNAETTISIDVLANGFKVRNNSTNENNTGSDTYIFAAFAEFPMGGSNVSPSPAR